MTTAFQPDAFQSDAFQEEGGVVGGSITIAINGTQEGDSGELTVNVATVQVGAAGRRERYVAFIDGKRYIGDLDYIQSVIEESAEQHAIEAITKAKTAKPRIVIQSGRKVPPSVATPLPEARTMEIQTEVRDYYNQAFARYMLELEQDEEDALMVLL